MKLNECIICNSKFESVKTAKYCPECRKKRRIELTVQAQQKNPGKLKENQKRYRESEKCQEYQKEYQKSYNAQYQQDNKDKIKAYQKEYREKHKINKKKESQSKL